jgi:hypothetical protein
MQAEVSMEEIARAMQPGRISREGFLGDDRRPLAEILAADRAEVDRLGTSHRQLADSLRKFRDAAQKGLGDWIAAPPDWEARADAVRGQLPCPFGDAGLFPKTMITVRNRRTGTELVYSDLSLHLVEAHGFYEGRGSPFRLEPEQILAVLRNHSF